MVQWSPHCPDSKTQAGKGGARSTVFATSAAAASYAALLGPSPHTDSNAAPAAAAGRGASGGSGGGGSLSAVRSYGVSNDPRVQGELVAMRDNVVAIFGAKVGVEWGDGWGRGLGQEVLGVCWWA